MPLEESTRELFAVVAPEGLFTSTRVPQGMLNATGYFRAVNDGNCARMQLCSLG